ncbi:MAG: DUF6544 family protein [Myxococcota bacterium]
MDRRWKIALGVAAGLAGIGIGASVASRLLFKRRIDDEARSLLETVAPRTDEPIVEEQLEGLPAPVARYLRYAGVVGRAPVRTARVRQSGTLRRDASEDWVAFDAIEYYAAAPPGYVWSAELDSVPFIPVDVRDYYIRGRGAMQGKAAGLFTIAEGRGPAIDQSAALRMLNELVFFPTAFLEPYIRWEAVDDVSARVHMKHWDGEVSATCYFARDGRMVDFVAERYRVTEDGPVKTDWRTPFREWEEIDGFRIPTAGSAIWILSDGEFEYIRVDVEDVEYEVGPEAITDGKKTTKRLSSQVPRDIRERL